MHNYCLHVYSKLLHNSFHVTKPGATPSRNRRARSTAFFSNCSARATKGAGVYKDGGGFHASRRGGVTELFEKGMQPDEVTRIMGWKSKSTVHEYNVISQRRAEKRFAKVHPNFQLPIDEVDRHALLDNAENASTFHKSFHH